MKRRSLWAWIPLGLIGCIAVVVLVSAAGDPYRSPPSPAGMIERFTTLETNGLPWTDARILVQGAKGSVAMIHAATQDVHRDVVQVFEVGRTTAKSTLSRGQSDPDVLGLGTVLDASRARAHLAIVGIGADGALSVRVLALPSLEPVTAWVALETGTIAPHRIVNAGDWVLDSSDDFAFIAWGGMKRPHIEVRSGDKGALHERIDTGAWPITVDGAVPEYISSSGTFQDAVGTGLAVLLSNRKSSDGSNLGDELFVVTPDGGTPVRVATNLDSTRAWNDVTRVGDVDGDGRDDLVLLDSKGLVLVRSSDHELSRLGDAGNVSPGADQELGGPSWMGARAGSLLSTPDVDGDGVDDVIWNVDPSRALVVSAKKGTVLLDDVDPARITSPRERAWPVGDVDGDGLADVALVYARENRSTYDLEFSDALFGAKSWVAVVSGAKLRDAAADRAR